MRPLICPYCHRKAKLVTGREVYPNKPHLALKGFWQCAPCNARVGCHDDGRPLGPLASPNVRRLRKRVHALLDPLWLKYADKGWARTRIYSKLAAAMGVEEVHIGEMTATECNLAIILLRSGEVTV